MRGKLVSDWILEEMVGVPCVVMGWFIKNENVV